MSRGEKKPTVHGGMVINEHRRFHRDPNGGGNRSPDVDLATAVLHAVADLLLVDMQSNLIQRLHGGASLVFLNQRSPEFSFFTPSAPPSPAFKLTRQVKLLPSCP
jgi:hypothetical protein